MTFRHTRNFLRPLFTLVLPIGIFVGLVCGGVGALQATVLLVIVLAVVNFEEIHALIRKMKERRHSARSGSVAGNEAVIVYLSGSGLPKQVYEQYDISTLEDRLTQAIQADGLGTYDGNERGPSETVLYMYGPDSEKLFAVIRPVLEGYPLVETARVLVRKGGPGSGQREVIVRGPLPPEATT